jgi:integrase
VAHIRRHPNKPDTWQVRYIDPTGKERSKGGFRRKIDADKYKTQVEAQQQRGEWIDPGRAATRLDEWSDQWLRTRSHLKPKTLAGYESLLRTQVLPHLGQSSLDRLDTISIEQWVADRQASGLSASRIRQAHQVLSAVLKSAVRNRYLPSNPAQGVKLPRLPQREMLFLSPAQIDELAMETASPFETLIYLLAYGGLRWGEAAALRCRGVDILQSRIEISESLSEVGGQLHFGTTKNHRNRTIVIPVFLRDMLNRHITECSAPGPDSLVFTASNGAPLRNPNFARNVWKPAIRSSGLPEELRVHDLRHTAAALLISEGAHPEAIKRQLGHSSIRVTMDTYGHLLPSTAEALADRLHAVYENAQTDIRRTNGSKSLSLLEA